MPSPLLPEKSRVGRLHVLTDFHFQQRYSHAEIARLAIEGGADAIQFRQKTGPFRAHLREARLTQAICAQTTTPLLINDRLDLALAVGASGIHLGQEDLPIDVARRIAPASFIIGATATTTEQAKQAWQEGADYIGFGPVFPTSSKANPASTKGLDGLARACAAVPIPVIAIAGITPERTSLALEAGAWGVAVMTAITCADNPQEATTPFREIIDAWTMA